MAISKTCPSSPLTYREALEIARARQPTRCPQCGSERIAPLFLDEADDSWDCADCFAIFQTGTRPDSEVW